MLRLFFFFTLCITLIFGIIPNMAHSLKVLPLEEKKDEFQKSLSINGRIQIRHEYNKLNIVDEEDSSFAVRRLRLSFSGYIYEGVFYYINFMGKRLIQGGSGIHSAYMRLEPSSLLFIQVGGYSIPWAREQALQSSGRLIFVDLTYASKKADLTGDIGILLGGSIWDKKLKYWSGIFNGAGGFKDGANGWSGSRSSDIITNNYYDVLARIQVDPLGNWSEGKMYFQKDLKLSVGASVYYSAQRDYSLALDGYYATEDFLGLTGDFAISWNRLFGEVGVYYLTAKANPAYGSLAAVDDFFSYYFKVGIFAYRNHIMIGLRWDVYEEQTAVPVEDTIKEGTLALTWFIGGRQHAVKLNTEIAHQFVKDPGASNPNVNEIIWRSQLTMNF
ncbi:MAG: hypothetical protein OEZ36_06875 [Spirochaetota bacterium]|nr:hypothetical protein [Spirochaetota bacterium]